MKILPILLLLLLPFAATAQKWSEYTETLILSNSWIGAVAVPGVTNYKFTIGTLASNIASKVTLVGSATNAVIGGQNLSVTNATSFGLFYTVQGLTNMQFFSIKQGTNMVIYRDGSNIVLNATGTGGSGGSSLVTNGNQFGPSVTLTIRDQANVTNVQHQGVITINGSVYQPSSGTNINSWYGSNYFASRIQIAGGGPASGRVLTSDAAGHADWQNPAVSTIDASNLVRVAAGANVTVTPSGAGGIMTYTVASTASGGSTFSNKNMFYVSMTGDNSTAKQGRFDLPYRDPVAAANAATNAGGGTVVCFAGLYTTNNLLRNGVNYFGFPGTILNFIDPGSGNGRGIFDDRDCTNGGCSSVISGAFDIRYSTGITGYNVGTISITPNPTNYLNMLGAINVTNALSSVDVVCSSICVTTLVTSLTVAAVNVKNCSRFALRCGRIYDGIYTNLLYIGDDDTATPVLASSGMLGVYWQIGKANVFVDNDIQAAIYAIWSHEPNGNTLTQHLHVTAGSVIENNAGAHAIYLEGQTAGYKSWVTAHEMVGRGLNGAGAVGVYGAGRYYVTAQKISNPTTAIYSAVGTQEAWISCPRVNAGGMGGGSRWVVQQGGKLDCVVSEWDDDGGITTGWEVLGGELIVYPGQADVANGKGLNVSGAGKAKFVGVTINTSAGNLMTNTPVFVATNNVILQNCVLVAPAAAPAIMAVSATTVLSYNGVTANKTNHPNITMQAGSFVTDSNVR